jgi:RNA recognition motif-containing protein
MSNRLYVGNISFRTESTAIRTALEQHGAVTDVHWVTDRENGQPRGFGFVTMAANEAAEPAIAGISGQVLDGRVLRVNEAEERPAGSRGSKRASW